MRMRDYSARRLRQKKPPAKKPGEFVREIAPERALSARPGQTGERGPGPLRRLSQKGPTP